MKIEQWTEGAQILDKINNEKIRIDELNELKDRTSVKYNRFELCDDTRKKVVLSKETAIAAIDTEISFSENRISVLESKFAAL